jgi:hypothetical protein
MIQRQDGEHVCASIGIAAPEVWGLASPPKRRRCDGLDEHEIQVLDDVGGEVRFASEATVFDRFATSRCEGRA